MSDLDDKTLSVFLTENIRQALARHEVEVSNSAQQYLIGMLERQFAEAVQAGREPITFQYKRILEETYELRRKHLTQQLGDHCLFLVGYFYDFVRKAGKGQVEYHTQIGSTAYQEAGKYPFAELSEKFTDLYLVIGDLHLPNLGEEKIIDLYQKWLETGDRYYESLLLGKGIVPQRIVDKNGN